MKAKKAKKLYKHVKQLAKRAEWKDKLVHFVEGPSARHWVVSLWLPVIEGEADVSPKTALKNLIKTL